MSRERIKSDLKCNENAYSVTVTEPAKAIIKMPRTIAKFVLAGIIEYHITDNMDWTKPTPKQAKNLHTNFCVDVSVYDAENDKWINLWEDNANV